MKRFWFFDLDGTLVDSISTIIACTRAAFAGLNLPVPSDRAIMRTIGRELSDGLAALLPPGSGLTGEGVARYYCEVYASKPEFQIKTLFAGLKPLFAALLARGYLIGYASGRSVAGIRDTLDKTFLGAYCDALCGGDEVPSKPDPAMLRCLCERLNVSPGETLMVGDADLDVLMAQRAGAHVLAVQSGVWSGEALATLNPELLLPRALDLLGVLETL